MPRRRWRLASKHSPGESSSPAGAEGGAPGHARPAPSKAARPRAALRLAVGTLQPLLCLQQGSLGRLAP
eukprot:11218232-Lingulodinium_polyedra.AAC.1